MHFQDTNPQTNTVQFNPSNLSTTARSQHIPTSQPSQCKHATTSQSTDTWENGTKGEVELHEANCTKQKLHEVKLHEAKRLHV